MARTRRQPEPIPGWHAEEDAPPPAGAAPGHPREFTDASRGERIQRVLAAAGVGSRRACEQLIAGGDVAVNGHIVTELPIWVDPHRDAISVRGRRIKPAEPYVYLMLFKPRGYVCTNDDPEDRPRAVDLVRHPARPRLYCVGRLDLDSSGLLLLTNDGEFANRLTHPRYGVHKIYEVTVAGALSDAEAKRLERGLFLSDERPRSRTRARGRRVAPKPRASRTMKSSLTVIKRDRDRTRLRMELHEGRNRQIRRMMAQLGHPVKKLRRIQLGPLKLKDLQPAQWRELTPRELSALRKAAHDPESGKQKTKSRKQKTSSRN